MAAALIFLKSFKNPLKKWAKHPINIIAVIKITDDFKKKGGDQMRIEAYTQVQQLYSAKKATQAKNSTAARFTDQVQISSKGKDILSAKAALAATPDIREDVTAPIKAKVQAGTYEVSAESFADKLLKKYEEMR